MYTQEKYIFEVVTTEVTAATMKHARGRGERLVVPVIAHVRICVYACECGACGEYMADTGMNRTKQKTQIAYCLAGGRVVSVKKI